MDKAFQEKAGKVVLVDASGATRALLSEVVRGLGFKDVTGVPTIKDALSLLEVEPVKWFIVPLMADQNENAMHLLQICAQHGDLRDVRVSLLVEDAESYCLGAAFEKGLISWHQKPFTKDSIKNDLSSFIKKMDDNGWDTALVAAEYLREQLTLSQQYEDLLNFEKNLIDLFPLNVGLLLNLIVPMVKLEKKDDAKAVLRRVMLLDNGLEAKVNDLAQKHFEGDYKSGGSAAETQNVLGLDRVVIVDSDDAIIKNVSDVLAEIGVKETVPFGDGEAALKYLAESPGPSLVIHEWRLQKVPGPLFIQRAKQAGAQTSPLVVLSSLIQAEDMPFVREMGVAMVLPKPIDKKQLLRSLVSTVMQDRSPSDQHSMERKMRELLGQKMIDQAKEIMETYMSNPQIPGGMKKTIEAEFALADCLYERARDAGIEALKMSGDSLFILNLLGKALMHLKDFPAATRCFEKAQTLSPLNIERLCHLAEVHSEMGDTDKAEAALDKAKAVDGDNAMVKETEAKVAVNTGQTERAKAIMNQLDNLSNVVAYMNNQAVSWARAGQVEKGIEQYHKTIKSIPDEKKEVLAVVNYNLALAHVRAQQYDEAALYLGKCIKLGTFRVTAKAKSLLTRINRVLESGGKVVLKLDSGDHAGQVADGGSQGNEGKGAPAAGAGAATSARSRDALLSVTAKRGEVGCLMVFHPKGVDARARVLFDNPPRFNARHAIERAASHGADKLMKTGS